MKHKESQAKYRKTPKGKQKIKEYSERPEAQESARERRHRQSKKYQSYLDRKLKEAQGCAQSQEKW